MTTLVASLARGLAHVNIERQRATLVAGQALTHDLGLVLQD